MIHVETMAQRHNYILNELEKNDMLKVSDLTKKLNVSIVTIRKDLKTLENKNLIYRTHGLIYKSNPYTQDINVSEKSLINAEQKKDIGKYAATLIEPNDAILIASGTTVLHFANAINVTSGKLTVVTSAMNVALALSGKANVEVIQLGGVVRPNSSSVVGPYAEEILKNLSFSKLFIGVDGVDENYGCSTSNLLEANLNNSMIKAAQKTIVLTDSSKFGKKGFGKICDLNEVDYIITDKNITEKSRNAIDNLGIELTIV
ncbi:DeoR/GlpR family DNA-binding transcription regulator [Chishuiella changwenlii]|jgi:DeoR family transcriptional regulator of aga operon|uniref:DeoR/GlpR family DNA-binding transcription regulator n=1 Tax=Chishuiella changwenlii TaxID=1434701 RepID=UPI002FD8A9B8